MSMFDWDKIPNGARVKGITISEYSQQTGRMKIEDYDNEQGKK